MEWAGTSGGVAALGARAALDEALDGGEDPLHALASPMQLQ